MTATKLNKQQFSLFTKALKNYKSGILRFERLNPAVKNEISQQLHTIENNSSIEIEHLKTSLEYAKAN